MTSLCTSQQQHCKAICQQPSSVHCRKPTLARCTICRLMTRRLHQPGLRSLPLLMPSSYPPALSPPQPSAAPLQPLGKISMPWGLTVQTRFLTSYTEHQPNLSPYKSLLLGVAHFSLSFQIHLQRSSKPPQANTLGQTMSAKQGMLTQALCWHQQLRWPSQRPGSL